MRRSVEKTLGRVSDCLCKGFPLTRTKPRSYIHKAPPLVVSMRIANKEKKSQPTTKALSVELRQKCGFTNV